MAVIILLLLPIKIMFHFLMKVLSIYLIWVLPVRVKNILVIIILVLFINLLLL